MNDSWGQWYTDHTVDVSVSVSGSVCSGVDFIVYSCIVIPAPVVPVLVHWTIEQTQSVILLNHTAGYQYLVVLVRNVSRLRTIYYRVELALLAKQHCTRCVVRVLLVILSHPPTTHTQPRLACD